MSDLDGEYINDNACDEFTSANDTRHRERTASVSMAPFGISGKKQKKVVQVVREEVDNAASELKIQLASKKVLLGRDKYHLNWKR